MGRRRADRLRQRDALRRRKAERRGERKVFAFTNRACASGWPTAVVASEDEPLLK